MPNSGAQNTQAPVLLLVDDDPADQELTRRLLAKGGRRVELRVVDDGDAALEFVRRQGRYEREARPHLLLLDMNMPKRSGLDVLREIRADRSLSDLVVIVLSTSDAEADIAASYALGANSYIVKPSGKQAMAHALRQIEEFWFGVAALPARRR